MEDIEILKKEFNDKISALTQKVGELTRIIEQHKHTGYDKTSKLDGSITLSDQSFITIGNSQIAAITLNGNTSSEENRFFFGAGTDRNGSFTDVGNNTQLIVKHQPGTTGSSNQSFFDAQRPPIYTGDTSITSGTATLSDTTKNWSTNSLANAYVNVYDSAGTFKESRLISSNTATQITVDANWTYTDSASTYVVYMPVYMGSSEFPWRRLYTMTDIRFGRGTSAGSDVIFIKFGSGTPEGAVTANVGSLYLRTDGSTSTTLYVKTSGTGNTGWTSK